MIKSRWHQHVLLTFEMRFSDEKGNKRRQINLAFL